MIGKRYCADLAPHHKWPLETPSSPRVRNMLDLLWELHGPRLLEKPSCSLDLSQSIHMTRFRDDGVLPTLSTNSATFIPTLGRTLTVDEELFLMGFSMQECRLQLGQLSQATTKRMVGNTMHVHVVGYVLLASMSVLNWSRSWFTFLLYSLAEQSRSPQTANFQGADPSGMVAVSQDLAGVLGLTQSG